MPRQRNDILQGTLALLVLKTLASQGRMHGYAITAHIQAAHLQILHYICELVENAVVRTEG